MVALTVHKNVNEYCRSVHICNPQTVEGSHPSDLGWFSSYSFLFLDINRIPPFWASPGQLQKGAVDLEKYSLYDRAYWNISYSCNHIPCCRLADCERALSGSPILKANTCEEIARDFKETAPYALSVLGKLCRWGRLHCYYFSLYDRSKHFSLLIWFSNLWHQGNWIFVSRSPLKSFFTFYCFFCVYMYVCVCVCVCVPVCNWLQVRLQYIQHFLTLTFYFHTKQCQYWLAKVCMFVESCDHMAIVKHSQMILQCMNTWDDTWSSIMTNFGSNYEI